MKLVVNGKAIQLDTALTIEEFLKEKKFNNLSVVIEHNYEILPAERFMEVSLKDGDNLEIVKFIGGG